jgi:hypothetical protein
MDEAERWARARHDLGRYVHLEARFVGPEGDVEELRAALISDLRRTRRGPGGDEDVAAVWARVRVPCEPVDRAVAELARRAEALDRLSATELRETERLAASLAELVRAFSTPPSRPRSG